MSSRRFPTSPLVAVGLAAGFGIAQATGVRTLGGAVFAAAGLGLFCGAGTVKALDSGLSPVAAGAVGVTTAVGGGVLRDVIARETPALVRPDSELYAVPAIAGAVVVVIAWEQDAYGPVVGAVAAVIVFVFRCIALQRRWRGPRAWRRQRMSSEDPRTSAAPASNA